MDFAKMKRRELQALCGQHGLAARGSNADLAASLAGALSGGASAAEKMVEVVVGKGCLKQPRGSSSGAAKKVTFVLEEKEEAGEALLASAVSGRGRGRKRVEIGGDSADEGVAGEVYADARATWSRTNTVNLHADSHNNLADAEEEREVVGAAADRKQKRKTQENAKGIAANAQAGLSHRSTRKSSLSAAADTHRVESRNNPVAAVSGRGNRRKRTEERGGDSSAEGVAGEVGADARVTRCKRNALSLSADGGVESRNIPAEAEEEGEVVREAIDSKWKRMTRENAEDISANAHAGISCRSTRSSSLSADAVLLCPVVEKKRERKKAGDSKDELGADEKAAEAQGLATAASPVIVESKRSRRKEEDCEPAVHKSVKVEVSGRVTRSCSVNAAATLPVAVETKRKWRTEDVHLDREPTTVSLSDVPRNDAPVNRSLRNRAVQISNSVLEETHVGKKLEKKRQPSGPAIRRHQQFASSVEEDKQVAAPCKCSPLHENVRGEEFQIAKGEDVGKQPAVRVPVRRSTRNCVVAG